MRQLFVLFLLLLCISTATEAQRGRHVSYEELTKPLFKGRWKLVEYRNELNEYVSNKVPKRYFRFSRDSIFLFESNNVQTSLWEDKKIAFNITNIQGKADHYQWIFGGKDLFCFIVNDNNQKIECYSKLHK